MASDDCLSHYHMRYNTMHHYVRFVTV